MAEESSVYELQELEKQLQSLLQRYSSDGLRAGSEPFCSDFCKLVEEYASRWQVPLPQLRVLETALCYFARASAVFASNCDHVLGTLSSLALSVFELLLFFDQNDFHQEPLKQFTVTFQECHLVLAKHQNVHLLQVEHSVQGGGPWAGPALQAILSESSLPQNEVDGYISSELPVFFELRVRYLLSRERVSEALALARCCARHPTAGQHLFFLQVYLTWLYKTSQHDRLHKEVADLSGKDAVHIICSLEYDEEDELLLALSTAFLSQQLRKGDMYGLCDLVFVWTKLHSRLNTSKQALLQESQQLMLSATNVNSIFPFIRAILQEVGEDGIQFCVELCANALESCLPCDIITKTLIYTTIAGLLPNDLEVCRACALLVFFLERTVESYKMVYLLYMHPDQEYDTEYSPIRNHVRFETLQILKKDLYFDPEFWNLIALRTNCLKLMSEKVESAALEEIMEDKWISNYCTKEPRSRSNASLCQKRRRSALQAAAKKRHHKEDRHHKDGTDIELKRLKVGPGKTRLNVDHTGKKKVNKGSRPLKEASCQPLRRSFWQLDRTRDSVAMRYAEQRRTTRLSEKNLPKRRIRKPRWLVEDSATLEQNNVPLKMKKNGLQHEKHHRSCVMKRSEMGQIKNNGNHKPSAYLKAREINNKHQKGFYLDGTKSPPSPQVVLELSLPDNELMGTFTEEHRGFPQVLLYKPTVKFPAASQPVKTVHRKEVVLRARDAAMFVQQLHCYARRQKGKGSGLSVHGSVSTITRSSVQGSPPKDPPRELCERSDAEVKGGTAARTTAAKDAESPVLQARKTPSARGLCEKSAVEMKVGVASQRPAKVTKSQDQSTGNISRSITLVRELSKKSTAEEQHATASQTLAAAKAPKLDVPPSQTVASSEEPCDEPAVEMKVTIASQSPVLDKVSKSPTVGDASETGGSQTEISSASSKASVSRDVLRGGGELDVKSLSSQAESVKKDSKGHATFKNDPSPARSAVTPSKASGTDQGSIGDISALTLVTEMVTELAPERLSHNLENDKQRAPGNSASKVSRVGSKPKAPHRIRTTSGCSVPEQEASVDDVQGQKGTERTLDIISDPFEDSEFMENPPESEESKLEYCCTFCSKDFKGSRVVAHAMFHYRKDECMFCGTMFKDDLLAMMHLSDHIEKLKRIKAQENGVSDTKDVSSPKTSAKAKTTNMSSGCRKRQKINVDCSESINPPDVSQSETRRLRSNDKAVDGPSLQEKQKAKHLKSKTAGHKLNGHIGKEKELHRSKINLESKPARVQQEVSQGGSKGAVNPRLQEKQDIKMESIQVDKESACSSENKEKKPLGIPKTATKQSVMVGEEKDVAPQEKVCCPVDGCSWFTDLSKSRVAPLYHALDGHYGEIEPLELAFRVGNGKCNICMRVLWSFEHFQHHVERHRLTPRHPCLHQGCTARFKTGIEMRRHTRRHSPLQAACCLPGCSQLFICLWALNLHEREHYAAKSSKPDKKINVQTGERSKTVGKKQNQGSKHTPAPTDVNETLKTAPNLREQASPESKRVSPLPASQIKQELKERNEGKNSNVLKNLSNKDTSAQPAVPNRRLRHTLRKGQVTSANPAAPRAHKGFSSSLLKHTRKARHKLRKRQVKVNTKWPKRKGRPPKLSVVVHDENTQKDEAAQGKAPLQDDQKSTERLLSPETVEAKKLAAKRTKRNQENNTSSSKVKNRPAPSDSSKAKSVNSKINKKPATSKSGLPQEDKAALVESSAVDKEMATVENTDSTKNASSTSELSVPDSSVNVPTAAEKQQKVKSKEKPKKSLHPKDVDKKGDKKRVKENRPRKDKTSALKKSVKSKCEDRQQGEAKGAGAQSTLGEEGKGTEEAALGSSGPSVPAVSNLVKEKAKAKTQKVTKKEKSNVTKTKKRKDVNKDDGAKIAKKVKDNGCESASKKPENSLTEVQPLAEGKAGVGDGSAGEGDKPPPTTSGPGYHLINGQAQSEAGKSSVCKDTLAKYGKKPYMRLPPTAYLDEKYITMPKRRKEAAGRPSPKNPLPELTSVVTALQRQRCANCFATFNSAEELQSHVQLQKCSNLFGFDSDDEGVVFN